MTGPWEVVAANSRARKSSVASKTHAAKLQTFYRKDQVFADDGGSISRSPEKPRLLLEYLEKQDLLRHLDISESWKPFEEEDFQIAHTDTYVRAMFSGKHPLCTSNGLGWSREFLRSVRFTNASLFHAVRHAVLHPETICFSPTSGFHHARPERGGGFCTFSGQVIASMRVFREFKLAGSYIDLDGHFGNSIEDSRNHVPDLDQAIPRGYNINPTGYHADYLKDLDRSLSNLKRAILEDRIHYVVFCHGADSHCMDDLGGQCTTTEWLECSRMVYEMIREVSIELGRPIPITLSLFGGYRSDDFQSVLSLHTGDLVVCLNTLCGHSLDFDVRVRRRNR